MMLSLYNSIIELVVVLPLYSGLVTAAVLKGVLSGHSVLCFTLSEGLFPEYSLLIIGESNLIGSALSNLNIIILSLFIAPLIFAGWVDFNNNNNCYHLFYSLWLSLAVIGQSTLLGVELKMTRLDNLVNDLTQLNNNASHLFAYFFFISLWGAFTNPFFIFSASIGDVYSLVWVDGGKSISGYLLLMKLTLIFHITLNAVLAFGGSLSNGVPRPADVFNSVNEVFNEFLPILKSAPIFFSVIFLLSCLFTTIILIAFGVLVWMLITGS